MSDAALIAILVLVGAGAILLLPLIEGIRGVARERRARERQTKEERAR